MKREFPHKLVEGDIEINVPAGVRNYITFATASGPCCAVIENGVVRVDEESAGALLTIPGYSKVCLEVGSPATPGRAPDGLDIKLPTREGIMEYLTQREVKFQKNLGDAKLQALYAAERQKETDALKEQKKEQDKVEPVELTVETLSTLTAEQLDAGLAVTENADFLKALMVAEANSEAPRQEVIDKIDARLAELSK